MKTIGSLIKSGITIAAFVLASAWATAEAVLITVDDPQYRDNGAPGVVLDTGTGLEWLKTTVMLTSWSPPSRDAYHDFLAALMPGQRFSGWSIASSTQVFNLMKDAGLPELVGADTTGQYAEVTRQFQQFLGAMMTGDQDPYYATWGLVSDTPQNGGISFIEVGTEQKWAVIPGGNPGNPEDYYLTYDCFFNGLRPTSPEWFNESWEYATPYPLTAWLVRDAEPQPEAVPEPSTAMLCASGLIALLAWRNKNKKA